MRRARTIAALAVSVISATLSCSIAIRRDLSTVPAGQVGFDDMCGLQEYFDALEIKSSPPPRVVSAADLEGASGGRPVRGGKDRFAFENDFQLGHLRRILEENWRRLPDQVAGAGKIEIEVKWSEKAATKRVVTNEDAALAVAGETFNLPYHPCLSELLYGAPLYRQRRAIWGLPLSGAPAATAIADGGVAARDGASEAGASEVGAFGDARQLVR